MVQASADAPRTRVLIPPLTTPPRKPPAGAVQVLSGATMGTTWAVRHVGGAAGAQRVKAAVQDRLERVVDQMSPWENGSHLSRFNAASAGEWLDIPAEFQAVLACALEVARLSDGAFDPTCGALTDLWGFGPAPFSGRPPVARDAMRAWAASGWRKVELLDGRLRQPGALSLDLCGIAKGFGVDQVAEGLEALGVRDYLVEVGGELRGAGMKPDGQPWWVELEAPPGVADVSRTLLALHGLSVATSGDYRRAFEHEGVRYGHTLDMSQAAPVRDPARSVTVLHASCMRADALATALLAMGAERARGFAESQGLAVRVISAVGETWSSPVMAEMDAP
jgi:thiamine biosynthesis lipoprotein